MVNPELWSYGTIERSMYVDYLISGGATTKQALEIKMTATAIFGVATFKLHKWHSKNQKLEVETSTSDEESQRYAKQQLEITEEIQKQTLYGSSEANNKQIRARSLKKTVYSWMCMETKREFE